MSKFDFDTVRERKGTGSLKWDKDSAEILPMWVADMDFKTAPCIIEAMKRKIEHGIFGYTHVLPGYYEAITSWFKRRHGWVIDHESIIYTSGVVPAISAIIKGLLKPGDGIIVQSPAYNCFFSSIRNNGCRLVEAPLIYHPDGYNIDFAELERLTSEPWIKMLILCNPHNPVGRVWTKDELLRIGEICLKNSVFVLSDEIHCELTYEGHDYTPYQSLGKDFAINSVACVSPAKAFNISGLQIANIVCPDPEIKRKVDRGINDNEVCDVNTFGVVGLIAAYNEGEEWLDSLRQYLFRNYLEVKRFFNAGLPKFDILPLEGTYLVWIDCSATGLRSDVLSRMLIEQQKLWLSPGTIYGEGGQNFLRLNIACPRAVLEDGLGRLQKFLSRF